MTATPDPGTSRHALVDDVPIVWIEPEARRSGTTLALWLPWLSGTKDACIPFLERLAGAGFVAVSLDPWQQGDRATETADEIAARVFGRFQREMWPTLGHTTLDALRVVDWAIDHFGTGPELVAGGVSMGGDIAVALAGIDPRVARVAAIVSTPDWTRPEMHDLADPSRLLPQGEPDALAQWYYEHLDPMTHLDSYGRGPAITFECAADDNHVPAGDAQRFAAALGAAYPEAGARVRVNLHPGLGHLDGARAAAPADAAFAWLTQP